MGEVEKDAHHEEGVLGARGIFMPLSVKSIGLWSPASLKIVRDIAVSTTNRNGAFATVSQMINKITYTNKLTQLHNIKRYDTGQN